MPKGIYVKWTPEMLTFIKLFQPYFRYSEIAEMMKEEFGITLTINQISFKLHKLGIYRENSGRFQKGHQTWNKGIKSPWAKIGKCREFHFKKGHTPARTRPIGEERYSQKDNQIYVKVSDIRYAKKSVNWRPRAHLVWQKHFGEIPKGYIVWHKNGNSTDDRIENLELITRQEAAQLAHKGYYDTHDSLKPLKRQVINLETAVYNKGK
ncbi:HNH endonuclease signature motif containing protein [Lonepinella koalarum]|uniref:HNH endonuclease signature motif containing protein n=1 Tax=Lonepinella koalarum TaxID=53417 RepID=UPI003F6DDCE0